MPRWFLDLLSWIGGKLLGKSETPASDWAQALGRSQATSQQAETDRDALGKVAALPAVDLDPGSLRAPDPDSRT